MAIDDDVRDKHGELNRSYGAHSTSQVVHHTQRPYFRGMYAVSGQVLDSMVGVEDGIIVLSKSVREIAKRANRLNGMQRRLSDRTVREYLEIMLVHLEQPGIKGYSPKDSRPVTIR